MWHWKNLIKPQLSELQDAFHLCFQMYIKGQCELNIYIRDISNNN